MGNSCIFRLAIKEDLPEIIRLLIEDELGKEREDLNNLDNYKKIFDEIDLDSNQILMVVEKKDQIIGTCHLTIIPSLSFKGSRRMNVESVRVDKDYRRQGIGKEMMQEVFKIAKERKCTIVQLTTHKKRLSAKKFYEELGFEASHEGMKLYLN